MNFIYSITPDGWISFIGSILSFAGVFITIMYTKKQFKYDKRISIKPYLDIKLNCVNRPINCFNSFQINEFKNSTKCNRKGIGIEITNLGQGNCLEFKLIEIRLNGEKINDKSMYIDNIKIGEKTLKDITFKIYYGDILNEVEDKYMGKPRTEWHDKFEDCIYKYPVNKIEMKFEYKDVLDNKYSKTIVIDVFIIFKIHTEGSPYFEVKNINFESVTYEINGNMTTEELIK